MTSTIDTRVTGARVTPDATLLLRADATREEWLAARREGIGGSDASVIAGVNRFSSLYGLWLDKTGQVEIDDDAIAARDEVQFGRRVEPILADWFTDLTGLTVRRAGLMASKARPWQRASVDRLVSDGGILECKSTGWRMADEWSDDQVADHAEVQTQHYLAVTGRSHAWVFALVDRTPVIRRVERDDELIAALTVMEERFWFDNVIGGVEPATNAQALPAIKTRFASVDVETVELPRDVFVPVFTRFVEAKAAAKAADTAVDAAEAALRSLVGSAGEVRVDGQKFLTCIANGTFSTKAFEAAHPAEAEACRVLRPVIDLDKVKTTHPDLYAAHRARVLRPNAKAV